MLQIRFTKKGRTIKLWQLLLAVAAVSLTLALLPNHRLGEMLFAYCMGVLLLAFFITLLVFLIQRLRRK